ncbi:MAG TPA: hypothetical protein VGV64_04350 [Thermoplasmata archaeon]|nr:hypothetical protein [Thermoplasmata archaeon]
MPSARSRRGPNERIALLLALLVFGVGLAPLTSGHPSPSARPTTGVASNGPLYPVTFTSRGLPSGSSFNVTVGGVTGTSTNGTVVLQERNGSYVYSAQAVSAFWGNLSPITGTFVVAGAPVAVSIDFGGPAENPGPIPTAPSAASGGLLVGPPEILFLLAISLAAIALAVAVAVRARPRTERPPGEEPSNPPTPEASRYRPEARVDPSDPLGHML